MFFNPELMRSEPLMRCLCSKKERGEGWSMQESFDNYPLVSVVIPTYKRLIEYLSRAVESVRNQTYQNIEIIIVDDSTAAFPQRAETEKYIQSLNDDRIQYYQNEKNCGGSLTRNRGISYAKGKFITFLDDDDEYMPRKVEKQVAFMESGKYDASLSEMVIFSKEGKVVDYRDYKDLTDFSKEGLFAYHLMKHLTGTPTYMFRADKLREIGGFDDAKMGQEFYLMAKAIRYGLKIGYLQDCDVKIYKHDGEGITSGTNKISGEKALYQYKKGYFSQLTAEQRRYIRFRHYAVMVVAYRRCGMYLKMLVAGMTAFACGPTIFFREVFGFVSKVLMSRKKLEENKV